MPEYEEEFKAYLLSLSCQKLTVKCRKDGDVVVPNTPILSLRGPIALLQLVETAVLNLCNYPTLIASLAKNIRETHSDVELIEDGLKFSQGTEAALLGAKYGYIGGVDSISVKRNN